MSTYLFFTTMMKSDTKLGEEPDTKPDTKLDTKPDTKPDEKPEVKRCDEVGEKPDVGRSIRSRWPALVQTSDTHVRNCPLLLPIYERNMNKSRCGILELMHEVYPAVRA